MFHYTHRHVHRCITAALYQLLVSAQLKLEVCIKMQIGSLNVNEPCVFQPHQSQDYLPKSALLHYQSRHWHWSVEYQEKHCFSTNKNRVLKPALTLWIGCMSLPKILGWLVVAKQSTLWEGGSFGGLHPAGSAPPPPIHAANVEVRTESPRASSSTSDMERGWARDRRIPFWEGDQRLLWTLCTPGKG